MRHPKETIHVKSAAPGRDETRQKLIQAGIEVFGRYGYEAATTRMLARAAGVNLAAIPYHFGGKEGLYHAVVQHIAEEIASRLGTERMQVLSLLEKKNPSREELLAALERLIRSIGRLMISAEFGGQFGPIIMREHLHPSSAFDRLFTQQMAPVHGAIGAVVAKLEGTDPNGQEAIIRAHTILGQIVSFRAMREAALRRLAWKTVEGEQIEAVCDVIVENCRRMFRKGRGG